MVIPLLMALGYDPTDPHEIRPELPADFRDGQANRVDYAICKNQEPIIAVECKSVGTDLIPVRGQLRSYFSALQTVRIGILTNGVRFEFFADSENPNVMDDEPFITLDFDEVVRNGIPADKLSTLYLLTNKGFDPDVIIEDASVKLVSKLLRTALMAEVREPSEDFCRLMLQKVGLKNIRRAAIENIYSSLVRSAIEEALVLPVIESLRHISRAPLENNEPEEDSTSNKIFTTDRELAVYRYVCRRLAFLVATEYEFSAIERIEYRDYVGKFVVCYDSVRKGRLFEYHEGSNGFDRFVFPEPFGEIVTTSIRDIDEALASIFARRIGEVGPPRSSEPVRLHA